MKKFSILMVFVALITLVASAQAGNCNNNVIQQRVVQQQYVVQQPALVQQAVVQQQYVATPVLVQQPTIVANSYGQVVAQQRVVQTPVLVQAAPVYTQQQVVSSGFVSSGFVRQNVVRGNGGVVAQGRNSSAAGNNRVVIREGIFGGRVIRSR